MTTACPVCGGTKLRDRGSGTLECATPRIMGILPPWMGPGPIGDVRPCGHHFRVQVGQCQDCHDPVTYIVGASSSRLICGRCQGARLSAHQAELRRQNEIAEAARERVRAQATAELLATTQIAVASQLLRAHDELLAEATCMAVWLKFVQAGALTPQHEIVSIVGRPTVLGCVMSRGGYLSHCGRWEERGARVSVFPARGAGRRHKPKSGLHEAYWKDGFDAWIDCDGNAGLEGNGPELQFKDVLIQSTFKAEARQTSGFILPAGQPFRTKSQRGQFGGRHLIVRGAVTMATRMDDPVGYARTVAAALEAGSE